MQQFDVVVVGGGIAGLTAGLFSARLGRSTLVLVLLIPGGHLATIMQIEDFPGFPQGVAGYDLGPMVQEQAALTLADFAGEVLVLHQSAIPAAQETYLRRVREQSKIRIQGNSIIEEILGEGVVTGVRVNGSTHEIAADAVFVYIGLQPNTGFLQGIADLDDAGRVRTDIWMRTRVAGLFAAGDVRADSASQAITAAGDGATAAIAADRYLNPIDRKPTS